MTPEGLAQTLENFLAGAGDAVVLEDGMVAFDLAQAKYSISGETHKCLLHLWSNERNVVRRVVDLETKRDTLRLAVCRKIVRESAVLDLGEILQRSEQSSVSAPDGTA